MFCYLVLGLVPGLELGLLEEELDSLEDCLSPDWTADLGRVLGPAPTLFTRPGLTVFTELSGATPDLITMVAAWSLCLGGGGGQSEPELGLSSLEPEENQDSRHDSQLEY